MPPLHSGQNTVLQSDARFKVLSAGRRWGKSRLGAAYCIANALQDKRAWWISPSYPMSQIGWREIKNLARQIPGYQVRESDRMVTFGRNGYAQVKSSDNPDSLRGEGLDFVVLDECAFMKEETWAEALRPALSDRKGSALFISTPKGRNFFWRQWMQGQDPENTEWRSWKFPTASNPYIDPVEIAAAQKSLAERIFQQEYLGEFVDLTGGVFRMVMEAATAQEQLKAQEGRQYIAGVDVATEIDFTVASVIDITTNEMIYMDRFNRVDYETLEDRLHALYSRYNLTTMVVEINSIGQSVVEKLVKKGMNIIPFLTTNATKQAAIQDLQSAFEHSLIKILPDPILIGELQAFEGRRSTSGSYQYSAPEGMHDDCVMSLAIAWQSIGRGTTVLFGA